MICEAAKTIKACATRGHSLLGLEHIIDSTCRFFVGLPVCWALGLDSLLFGPLFRVSFVIFFGPCCFLGFGSVNKYQRKKKKKNLYDQDPYLVNE